MALNKGDVADGVTQCNQNADPQQAAQPVENLKACVVEARDPRHRGQDGANKSEKSPDQQCHQPMTMKQVPRSLVILHR